MNNIKKQLRTSTTGYYAVIIKADYDDPSGDDVTRTSYGETTPAEFAQGLPLLRRMMTNLIGVDRFYDHVNNLNRSAYDLFRKITGIDYDFPRIIHSKSDVKITYTDPNGIVYNVTI